MLLSQGGVPGASRMLARGYPASTHEIKYRDVGVVTPTAGTAGNWFVSMSNVIGAITNSVGSSNRIGRAVRIVGVVYRLEIVAALESTTSTTPRAAEAVPWCADFVWDKQTNSLVADIQDIYTAANVNSFPNPFNEHRFQFAKRLKNNSPNQKASRLDGSFKCNKLVTFSGNTGTVIDVETNNLLFLVGSSNTSPIPLTVAGTIRVLFVDA
jgi:hypothetical protein